MKKLIWIIVAVVIVVGVVLLVQKKSSPLSSLWQGGSPSPSATPKAAKPGQKTTPTPVAQVYTQLLNQYAGKTIQFNDKCQAQPGQMVLKKGTKILLDNRSTIAKTLSIDGQTISLGAYGYQIVTITTNKSLPYDLGIDCKSQTGTGENSAVIKIQATILKLLND